MAQRGFALAKKGSRIVAILHKTMVAEIHTDTQELVLANGGWVTTSTAKAINEALKEANLYPRMRVGFSRVNCEMWVETMHSGGIFKQPFVDNEWRGSYSGHRYQPKGA